MTLRLVGGLRGLKEVRLGFPDAECNDISLQTRYWAANAAADWSALPLKSLAFTTALHAELAHSITCVVGVASDVEDSGLHVGGNGGAGSSVGRDQLLLKQVGCQTGLTSGCQVAAFRPR